MYFLSYWYYRPEVKKALSKPVMNEFSDTTSQKENSTVFMNPATDGKEFGKQDTKFWKLSKTVELMNHCL